MNGALGQCLRDMGPIHMGRKGKPQTPQIQPQAHLQVRLDGVFGRVHQELQEPIHSGAPTTGRGGLVHKGWVGTTFGQPISGAMYFAKPVFVDQGRFECGGGGWGCRAVGESAMLVPLLKTASFCPVLSTPEGEQGVGGGGWVQERVHTLKSSSRLRESSLFWERSICSKSRLHKMTSTSGRIVVRSES